ncbi:protein of unknown function [Methylotuvimicrobium alcaliphilum 20Z]|uniref:Uncharacterized protein n=1 Tax=Methylotuvimicrobium alcaliphilum (strain DSM 19304 / NCIMB 14124 / VKM B-2133 / 20Z) TaxID=1091494 RepID=G4SX33_META2|nr:protein of unknown function [Methylotuvimicrobium alcaliphilum 20Z]
MGTIGCVNNYLPKGYSTHTLKTANNLASLIFKKKRLITLLSYIEHLLLGLIAQTLRLVQ